MSKITAGIDQKLEVLYDLLVDNVNTLETELTNLIVNPTQISNTNKFASLLSELKNPVFINPLLKTISLSNEGDAWLTDFLYGVINLLEDSSVNDEFEIPEGLINKLEIWILDSKNELSWKAAILLKFYESESAEKIQLKKLEGYDDFFLIYVECILGLLRYNEDKYIGLVEQIAKDEIRDKNLRAACEEILENYHSKK